MALTADRITRRKAGGTVSYPVEATTTIYCGSIVAVNASGYAIPASPSADYRVIGIARHTAANTGSAGDMNVEVDRGGSYELENSGTYAIAQADAGRICYVQDDQTVADIGGGGLLVAGVVDSIDPVTAKVWVKIHGAEVTYIEADETSEIETKTSGALSTAMHTSLISITGTKAFTLADGTFEGQRKTIVCTVASTTPVGTITPAHYADGTAEIMTEVGEMLELEWHSVGGWKKLFQNLGGGIETVTTGAISNITRTSKLSITGTQAFTLADGIYEGQRKTLVCSVAATTPAGTITPATYADGTSEHMSAVGELLELEWHTTGGWTKVAQHLGVRGAETVTTGALSLFTETSFISVTGTIAYTLADGLYVGQKKYCRCTVAASTPDGTLTPAHPTGFSTADFDATEEAYCFSWNGAAWECLYVIGGALS